MSDELPRMPTQAKPDSRLYEGVENATTALSEGEERKTEAWPLRSAADVALDDIPPIVWDVVDLIARDSGPVMIFGMPESLKSLFAQHV